VRLAHPLSAAVTSPARPGRPAVVRLLVVQTNTELTPDVQVARTLLQHGARSGVLEILLVQGTRAKMDSPAWLAFSDLAGITSVPLDMGGLKTDPKKYLRKVPHKLGSVACLVKSTPRLIQIARKFQPDAVYSASHKWDMRLAAMLSAAIDVPHIAHLHYHVGPWLGRGSTALLRRARLNLCISDFLSAQAAKRLDPTRLRTLHNALDVQLVPESAGQRNDARCRLRLELRIPQDSVVVGMVARLNPIKGQVQLLESMIPILKERPRVHVVFVGSDDIYGDHVRNQLERIALDSGFGSQIHLLGRRTDVSEILLAIDVFAHPSRWESFGMSVLEAMARSLPVVALREGAMPEIVLDGITGVLVAPENRAALTAAVDQLVSNPLLAQTMGEAGRRRAISEFAPDGAVNRFVRLVRESLDQSYEVTRRRASRAVDRR
jgi:glycosyltransferase involved in cell wall biosynthesis